METLALAPKNELYDREIRARNDATTWLAETLNGRMRTSFDYYFDDLELYADDGGRLGQIFEDSLGQAELIAEAKPELNFEVRRRRYEIDEYHDMLKMAAGDLPNTMITISDFPPELMNSTKNVGGYNTSRKQTMLRIITRMSDGRLRMQSQSLDGSNRQALEAIYAGFGLKAEPGELLGQRIYSNENEIEQEFLIDKLTGVYDNSLELQNPGKKYRAGRILPDLPGLETYQFVQSQPDLINYMTEKMLAGNLDEQVMFSVAATMASRYDKSGIKINLAQMEQASPLAFERALMDEIYQATERAAMRGDTYSGCGASVGARSTEDQLAASGFGNKTGEKNSWHGGTIKKGKCVNCHEFTDVGVESWCKQCISGHCGSK